MISSFSATYAASNRIRERILALVPGFRDHSERINQIIFQHEQQRGRRRAEAPARPRFAAVERLLDRAAERGVKLCVVAYPRWSREADASTWRRSCASYWRAGGSR